MAVSDQREFELRMVPVKGKLRINPLEGKEAAAVRCQLIEVDFHPKNSTPFHAWPTFFGLNVQIRPMSQAICPSFPEEACTQGFSTAHPRFPVEIRGADELHA